LKVTILLFKKTALAEDLIFQGTLSFPSLGFTVEKEHFLTI
jgi:hypothetical protein